MLVFEWQEPTASRFYSAPSHKRDRGRPMGLIALINKIDTLDN